MDTCLTCKYTPIKEGGALTCQRYPKQVRVSRTYVCGEWRPDVAKKEAKSGTDKKPARE